MYVSVHVRPDVAEELAQNQADSRDTKQLLRLVARYDGQLVPLHPGSGDPQLAAQYFVGTLDDAACASLAEALSALPAVEAAYAKGKEAEP